MPRLKRVFKYETKDVDDIQKDNEYLSKQEAIDFATQRQQILDEYHRAERGAKSTSDDILALWSVYRNKNRPLPGNIVGDVGGYHEDRHSKEPVYLSGGATVQPSPIEDYFVKTHNVTPQEAADMAQYMGGKMSAVNGPAIQPRTQPLTAEPTHVQAPLGSPDVGGFGDMQPGGTWRDAAVEQEKHKLRKDLFSQQMFDIFGLYDATPLGQLAQPSSPFAQGIIQGSNPTAMGSAAEGVKSAKKR